MELLHVRFNSQTRSSRCFLLLFYVRDENFMFLATLERGDDVLM